MFSVILHSQWKWSRALLLFATPLALAVPLVSVRQAATALAEPRFFLMAMEQWGAAYAIVAGVIGLTLAFATWSPDHAGRHVYALALPVARWRYVLMRFAAGALLAIVPVLALAVGAVVATQGLALPPGLNAYPFALSLRFALATFVAFALVFAISSGTKRTAGIVLLLLAALPLGDWVVVQFGGRPQLVETAVQWLFVRPGILSVFGGRWLLVDV